MNSKDSQRLIPLIREVQIFRRSDEDPNLGFEYHCMSCGKIYHTPKGIIRHITNVHGDKDYIRFIAAAIKM